MNKMGKKIQVSKTRYFVFYITQACFTFVPIVLSIMLLFSLTKDVVAKNFAMTFFQNKIEVIGLVLCVIVPISIGIGWFFLRVWVLIAKPGMTREEIRIFIERGLGINAYK